MINGIEQAGRFTFYLFRIFLSWRHYHSLIRTHRDCQLEIAELMDLDPKVIFVFLGDVGGGLVWAPCKRYDFFFFLVGAGAGCLNQRKVRSVNAMIE